MFFGDIFLYLKGCQKLKGKRICMKCGSGFENGSESHALSSHAYPSFSLGSGLRYSMLSRSPHYLTLLILFFHPNDNPILQLSS